MGALFFFDKEIPSPKALEKHHKDGHQLEVFTTGDEIFIRMSPTGEVSSEKRYTGILSKEETRELI